MSSEFQLEADAQVRALLRDHWGSQALEDLIADCLSRLAETHGIYLCEAQYEIVEFDLLQHYHLFNTKKLDCSECEWPQEFHLADDYICFNCRAIKTFFPDLQHPRDYDVYTSQAKDPDGNVMFLDLHTRWGGNGSRWERDEIFVHTPIPDSYTPACRPVSTLAFEYLHYKADIHDLESHG